MKVPFIDLKRFESGFQERWLERVSSMTQRTEFIGGQEVATLEERLVKYAQVNHAITCANGTDAIQLALRAVGIGREDIVLVPNMTFWATFEAVINVGAIPVTVDIDLSDGGIDIESLDLAINKYHPKGALIAHLYGWGTSKLEQIRALCRDHNVSLIEDGAQCFGATYKNSSIYKGALISTTSFYPAKVFGGAGDGGAVFTNDHLLAEKVRQLGNHGRSSHYGYSAVGWNSRLDSLQAAFLNISLDYLPKRLESRLISVNYYNQNLSSIGIKQIKSPNEYIENGYCNVCIIENELQKATLQQSLKDNGIGFGNIYPGVMSEQPGATSYLRAHIGGNNAQQLCKSVLNLPLFPYMEQHELDSVITTIANAL